jgi:tyrosyl-tRNA synthetase
MDVKKKIAFEIIKKFWSASEAEYAQKQFEELFQKKDYSYAQEIAWAYPTTLWIVDLIKKLGISGSSSEFKRLIEAGAVSLDGHAITDFKAEITVRDGSIVRVGKTRIFKLVCT